MWARAVPVVVLVLIGQASAQSPSVVPYPRDYKTSLVKYAVVDHSDGMSRDLSPHEMQSGRWSAIHASGSFL
jgi:hypothetical protein